MKQLPPEYAYEKSPILTLDDGFDAFIVSRKAHCKSLKTIRYYDYNLSRFITYCKLVGISHVNQITERIFDGFIVEMKERPTQQGHREHTQESYFEVESDDSNCKKLSGAYVHTYARVVRTFVFFLYDRKYIDRLPIFSMPDIPKKDKKFFTSDEVKELLAVLDTYPQQNLYTTQRNKILLLFAVDSGLRLEEISNVTWRDVNLTNGQVRVMRGKGEKFRVVGIGFELLAILHEFKRQTLEFLKKLDKDKEGLTYLFMTEDGYRLSPRGIDSVFERLGNKSNTNVSCHTFRRTCARNLLLAHKDLIFIQTQLGHENIEQTRRYIQGLTPEIHVEAIQRGGSAADAIIRDRTTHRRRSKNSDRVSVTTPN